MRSGSAQIVPGPFRPFGRVCSPMSAGTRPNREGPSTMLTQHLSRRVTRHLVARAFGMALRGKEDWLIDFLRRERQAQHDTSRPLIVGLQGPQGSGA